MKKIVPARTEISCDLCGTVVNQNYRNYIIGNKVLDVCYSCIDKIVKDAIPFVVTTQNCKQCEGRGQVREGHEYNRTWEDCHVCKGPSQIKGIIRI